MSARVAPPLTSLRGRRLLFARVAWVAVAVTALAIILFSVPSSFEYYRGVCTYDARKTLESFSAKLREKTDLDALNDDLIDVV